MMGRGKVTGRVLWLPISASGFARTYLSALVLGEKGYVLTHNIILVTYKIFFSLQNVKSPKPILSALQIVSVYKCDDGKREILVPGSFLSFFFLLSYLLPNSNKPIETKSVYSTVEHIYFRILIVLWYRPQGTLHLLPYNLTIKIQCEAWQNKGVREFAERYKAFHLFLRDCRVFC